MDSENLHRRLKKIIGQLNAIDRMIDEDIPCENILMQMKAFANKEQSKKYLKINPQLNKNSRRDTRSQALNPAKK